MNERELFSLSDKEEMEKVPKWSEPFKEELKEVTLEMWESFKEVTKTACSFTFWKEMSSVVGNAVIETVFTSEKEGEEK